MADLSAGTVSLPVKPDTAGFAAILGKSVLSATESVSKAASERFTKIFGATTAAKSLAQNRVTLAAAADVERASMKVRVAQDAEISSAAKLRIAEAQLTESRLKYAAGTSQVIRAEERVAAAERLHASTTGRIESATAALVPVQARYGVEQEKLTKIHERGRTALGRFGDGFKGVGGAIASIAGPLAIAGGVATVLGVEAVKSAANFQTATTRLVTDAGESAKNLRMIQAGILKISTATGTGAGEIAKGMYLVESAGYHGAAGLKVMAAAAEGAKIGGADLTTVSDALTTAMTDYAIPAGKAAETTSKLIATVSVGKTTMEQLAGSLHSVLPAAEAAHISLAQVLGAVGTMTAEGISADQATQNLNHAILSLQNPTQVQTKAMAAMGLSALDVAKNLGKNGLTGTLDNLEQAVIKHMGKSGLVLQNAFNQSKVAAKSAEDMLSHLPPSLQKLGKSYLDNTISQKDWTKALKEQPALTAAQGRQFATVAKNAHGFSDALKSGSGPASTFVAQLAKMTGGSVGLQVALHLSGIHADTFARNVKSIGGATAAAGGHVKDWATIQATFNQKMSEAKTSLENAGITIGTALMPAIEKLLPYVPKIAKGFSDAAPTIKSMADAIGKVFDVVGPIIGQIVKFTNGLGSMNGAGNKTALVMQGLHGKFGPILQALAQFGYTLGRSIGVTLNWAKSVGKSFADGGKQIGGFFASVGKWFAGLGRSFGDGAKQIGSFFKGVVKVFADGWKQITGFFSGAVKNFAHGWQQITGVFNLAISGIKKILTTGFLIAFGLVVLAWNKIVQIFGPTWNKITKIVAAGVHAVQSVIAAALKFVSGIWNTVWGAISSFVSGIWKAITSHISSGTHQSSSIISGALKWIQNLWNTVWGAITSFVSAVWQKISSIVASVAGTIRSTVASFLAYVWGVWVRAWNSIVSFLAPIWNSIVSAVSSGVSKVVSFISSIGSKVIGVVSGFGTLLYDAGRNLIQGLINGVSSMVGGLISTVSNIAGNAISAAKNALGIRSPSTVFHEIGGYVAQGLANGIKAGSQGVHDAVSSMTGGTVTVHAGLATSRSPQAISPTPASASDRPIYADGTLFGWIRELANGEATLVVDRAMRQRSVAALGGSRALT